MLNFNFFVLQDRFKDWEASGVRIIPVLSQPDDQWNGERGYVQVDLFFKTFISPNYYSGGNIRCEIITFQEVFSKVKKIFNPSSTGAVLCGHNQMMEVNSLSFIMI